MSGNGHDSNMSRGAGPAMSTNLDALEFNLTQGGRGLQGQSLGEDPLEVVGAGRRRRRRGGKEERTRVM